MDLAKTPLFVRKQPGGIFTVVDEINVTGDIYWFDGGASVNGSGRNPDDPFNSLQSAIDACTDNQGDLIIVKRNTYNPAAVINVNCPGITIVSQSFGHNRWQPEKCAIYPAATYATGPVMIITQPCRIVGLEIVTRFASGTPGTYTDAMTTVSAAIAIAGEGGGFTGGFCEISHCRFVDWWGNYCGIYFGAGAYNYIHDCVFESFNAGIYFRGTTSNNPDSNRISNNWFKDCTYGIEHGTVTAHNFLYDHNFFVDSKGVNHGAQAGDGLICDNYYETATDTGTYDETVVTCQADGIQFSGNHYSE